MAENPYQSYRFDEAKSSDRKEYFSGANVKVYFGDVWIDQLADISFSMQEQVAPIYGFRSYSFDRVSRGSRFVEGEFTLHFTENGYLQSTLERIASNMSSSTALTAPAVKRSKLNSNTVSQNIEDLLASDYRSKESYQEQIDALKESFWGQAATLAPSTEKKDQDVFYYSERSGEENPLRKHGFNILIDYSPDANNKDFLDCINGVKDSKSFYQTFRSIIGVHIVGEQQVIANNGQPIAHRYRFIAQDLDGDITRPSLWRLERDQSPTLVSWQNANAKATTDRTTAYKETI